MILRKDEKFDTREINVFMNGGGIGDLLCYIPALRAAATDFPANKFHVQIPVSLMNVYKHFFGGSSNIYLTILGTPTERRDSKYFDAKGNLAQLHTTLGTNLIDYGFYTILDRAPKKWERGHAQFKFAPEDRDGSVLLTPGYTAKSRMLPGTAWNAIADGLRARGCAPKWVGAETALYPEGIDWNLAEDLRGTTPDLLDTARLIHKSGAVIGLDNGLIHVAAMTPTPIVVGYSSQLPELRQPMHAGELRPRTEIVKTDGCNGCEARIRFNETVDFRECYFGDYQCISNLNPQLFLDAFDRLTDNACI